MLDLFSESSDTDRVRYKEQGKAGKGSFKKISLEYRMVKETTKKGMFLDNQNENVIWMVRLKKKKSKESYN